MSLKKDLISQISIAINILVVHAEGNLSRETFSYTLLYTPLALSGSSSSHALGQQQSFAAATGTANIPADTTTGIDAVAVAALARNKAISGTHRNTLFTANQVDAQVDSGL